MARIALAMTRPDHPAALGPCARPRFLPDEVQAALIAAGHQLTDGGPADVRVVELHTDAPAGDGPLVLVSLGRPIDPWHQAIAPAERDALLDPWAADLDRRRRTALDRRADAYADHLPDLLAAIDAALAPPRPEPPALRYLGALFNTCMVRPGTVFELDVEPRPLVLGRGTQADVHVLSPQLARAHLQLTLVPDHGLQLVDLGGTNRTWLVQPDGAVTSLRAGAPVVARPGALIIPDGSFRFLVV